MTQLLRPIHANRGVIASYKRQLVKLTKEMSDSYLYWITAAYNANPPLASDAMPYKEAKDKIDDLGRRWLKRFEVMAETIAQMQVTSMTKITDTALKNAFKEAGWTVDFQITKAMKDVMGASITENVTLIKSIQQQYHTKIEAMVMRNFSTGKDIYGLRKDIEDAFPIAERRAITIARDQMSKLNISVQNARYKEAGIIEAKWLHSHGGKEPRQDHVAADGKKYNINEGCLISGEYIHPGEKINCRCVSRAILSF